MSAYKIKVIIESQFGEVIAEAWAPMSSTFADAIQPLKTSDASFTFFDTPPAVVRRVKADRVGYERALTPQITKVLLDAMSAKDLFNGYTKAEAHLARKG